MFSLKYEEAFLMPFRRIADLQVLIRAYAAKESSLRE
jgi:hypothetical protein